MSTPELHQIDGHVFVRTSDGCEFGTIRPRESSGVDHPVIAHGLKFLADDDCGNAFALRSDGSVVFWDHETNQVEHLAASLHEFISHSRPPKPVTLRDGQVKSAWIDPNFAKQIGIDVDGTGWIKKPKA